MFSILPHIYPEHINKIVPVIRCIRSVREKSDWKALHIVQHFGYSWRISSYVSDREDMSSSMLPGRLKVRKERSSSSIVVDGAISFPPAWPSLRPSNTRTLACLFLSNLFSQQNHHTDRHINLITKDGTPTSSNHCRTSASSSSSKLR